MFWQYKSDVKGTTISNAAKNLISLYSAPASKQNANTTTTTTNTTTNTTASNTTKSTNTTKPTNTTNNTTSTNTTTKTNTTNTTGTTTNTSVAKPTRTVSYPVRLVYIDSIAQWWGDAIATGMGVPGFAQPHIYNYVVFAFWLSSGPADVAMIWSSPLKYFGTASQFGSTTQ